MISCTLLLAISEFGRVRGHYDPEDFEECSSGLFAPVSLSELRLFLERVVHKALGAVGVRGVQGVRLFDDECAVEVCVSQRTRWKGLQNAKPVSSKSAAKESPFNYLAKANPETKSKIADFLKKWRLHIEKQVMDLKKPQLTPGESFDVEDAGWDLRIITWGEEMGNSKKLAKLNQLGTIVGQFNPEVNTMDEDPKKNHKETLDCFLDTEITDHEESLSLFFEPDLAIKPAN